MTLRNLLETRFFQSYLIEKLNDVELTIEAIQEESEDEQYEKIKTYINDVALG